MQNDSAIDQSIEAIYPLTPMQQGMLFHSVLDPGTGIYVQSTSCSLRGSIDVAALRRAWRSLVERHGALRTSFLWGELARPLQIVHKAVELDWTELDWSSKSACECEPALEQLVDSDVLRGFQLDRAPLMRITLIRMPDGAWRQIWTYHHILLDGWSLPIILDELSKIYEFHARGVPPSLASPRPFRAYIAWMQQRDSAADDAYWSSELSSVTEPTSLTVYKGGTALAGRTTKRPADHDLALSPDVSDRLRRFARDNRLTVNTIIQGAWGVLLSRYGCGDDVLFGTTLSGRTAAVPGVDMIVGLFINTVPVRIEVCDDMPVVEWLESIQRRHIEREEHSFKALKDIQKRAGGPAGAELFDTLLVFENYPRGKVLGGESDALGMYDFATREHTNFRLTINVVVEDAISLGFSFDPDVLERRTIERMADHFCAILRSVIADPRRPVGELELLSASEISAMVEGFNRTESDCPDACLHHLIEAQVARSRDETAVIFQTKSLTYGELNARANRLAHHLLRLGVGRDALVGVCAERSLEMVVALLAILKAGGAYVPIDPDHPSERIHYMLENARIQIVLAQARFRDMLPAENTIVLYLDDPAPIWKELPDIDPASDAAPADLAYVIYTSGSTGRPKGAMNTHRGIVNRLTWMQARFGLVPKDRILQKTPYSFDVSVWEFFWPLIAGASLVLAQAGGHRDNAYLTEIIHRERITTVHFVPSMLRAMLEEPGLRRCAGLMRVICSGEALSSDLARDFFQILPTVELHNLYGPTECAIDVTGCRVAISEAEPSVPIGQPIANTRIYVLDPRKRPVPLGVAGEIYIGGVQVGRGYVNQPELTATSFMPDPFASSAGAKMYRTGDFGRWTTDGVLEFRGRKDHQVKIRGNRIELDEIEIRLREFADVRDAVVVAHERRAAEWRIVAYVASSSGHEFDLEGVRAHLRMVLPEYMRPAAYVVLDSLPLNANGKLDRHALPEPDYDVHSTFVAPRTQTEEQLAQIVANVLALEEVGVTDNFFDLGGDSILLLQVVARSRNAGLQLTARHIYDHPTVAELAKVATGGSNAPIAHDGGPEGPAELTPIQCWFFSLEARNPHHFNQSALFVVPASIRLDWLEQSLRDLVARHDALRTNFERDGDHWRPFAAPETSSSPLIETIELGCIETDAIDAAIEAEAERIQASLNITRGPLLRVALFRCEPAQISRLLIVVHHLAIDSVSWRILTEDIEESYRRRSTGRLIAERKPRSTFSQWSARLSDYARSERLRSEASYWDAACAIDGSVPTDRQVDREANDYESMEVVGVSLDAEATDALLQAASNAYRSHVHDLLLAGLARTMTEWNGRAKVSIDIERHGREDLFEDLDLSRTIGWFTSLFPVAFELGDASADAAVKLVRDGLRSAPSRGVGYGALKYLTNRQPRPSWTDPDVCFNYLGRFEAKGADNDAVFHPISRPMGQLCDPKTRRAHLIDIIGEIRDGRLSFDWAFSRRSHDRPTIERVARRHLRSLKQLIDHASESADARIIRGAQTIEYDPLVVIQSGKREESPVICAPGIGGSVIYFSPLAQRLGDSIPVYGLQPRGFDADLPPHVTITDMADAYVEAVHKLNISKPIRLLGHSLGAMVVFEMARRLSALGYELAPVVLLDPPTLAEMAANREKPGRELMLSMITQFLTNRYGSVFELDEQAWSAMTEDQRIEYLRQKMVAFKLISPRTPFNVIKSKVRMVVAHGNLDYWPSGPFSGEVVILRPEQNFEFDSVSDLDPCIGWARFAPALRLLESEGDHMTMLGHVTVNALMRNLTTVWLDRCRVALNSANLE